MKKPSKYDLKMMETAFSWAELSSAKRLKVGAVLGRNNRPLAIGYNGTPPGMDNSCEIVVPGTDTLKTKNSVIHAEENIFVQCSREGINAERAILYCTHSPCCHCAALLASIPISMVYYANEYRDTTETVEIFLYNNIPCLKMDF